MSKASKRADQWRQVFASEHDRSADWCCGCGYAYAVNGFHRDDCTTSVVQQGNSTEGNQTA
jgi:hypothetical protein